MAQLRFVGLTEDLTQEIHLLMLQAVTQPRIVSGMSTSVQAVGGDLYLVIQPGIFIMPDGMVVEETAAVTLPLIPPTTNQNYDVTLVAYRSNNSAIMNDQVFYQIVPGKRHSATLSNFISTTNITYMPISWINYNYSSKTFTTTDLGDRKIDNSVVFKAPFDSLVTDTSVVMSNSQVSTITTASSYKVTVYGQPNFTDDIGVFNITANETMTRIPYASTVTSSTLTSNQYTVDSGVYTFSTTNNNNSVRINYITGQGKTTKVLDNDLVDSLKGGSSFYFRVPNDPNQFISSINFEGKSDRPANSIQTISIRSMMNSDSRLASNYSFSTGNFQINTLNYPTDTYMTEDLLEIKISGTYSLYMKSITINKTRIF